MLSPALASPRCVCVVEPRVRSQVRIGIDFRRRGWGSFFLRFGQPVSLDGTDRDNRPPKSWVSEGRRLGGSVVGLLD